MSSEYEVCFPLERRGDRLFDANGRMVAVLESMIPSVVKRVLAYPPEAYDQSIHVLPEGWNEGIGYRVTTTLLEDEDILQFDADPREVWVELALQGVVIRGN